MDEFPSSPSNKPAPSTMSLSTDRPEYNSQITWTVVPQYPPNDPIHRKTSLKGNPGVYKVTFILSIPGENVYRERVNLGNEKGDSLIVFPPDIDTREIEVKYKDSHTVLVVLSANIEHHLATAEMTISALSFPEAEQISYETISSLLSYLSYVSDTAIETAGYEIQEESTGTLQGTWGMIGKTATLAFPQTTVYVVIDDNFKRIFAAYREGMNATNVFYQALSFFKVIEGCQKLRERKNVDAKSHGIKPSAPNLFIPKTLDEIPVQDRFLLSSFAPFVGQKFTKIIEQLRPLIRNAIAHIDPSRDILDIDHYEDVDRCKKVIPVLRYIAHCLIEYEQNN
jgi:hypothetical protein